MYKSKIICVLSVCMMYGHVYAAVGRAAGAVSRAGTVAVGAMRGEGLPLWRAAAGNAGAFDAALFGVAHQRAGYDIMGAAPQIFNPSLARPGAPVRPISIGVAQGGGLVRLDGEEGGRSGAESQTTRARNAREERRLRLAEAQELGAGRAGVWNESMEQSAKAERARRKKEALERKAAEKAQSPKPARPKDQTSSGSIFSQARRSAQQDAISRMSPEELQREYERVFGFPRNMEQGLRVPESRVADLVPREQGALQTMIDTEGIVHVPGEPGYEDALTQQEAEALQAPLPPLSAEELAEWEVLVPSETTSEVAGELSGPVIDADFEEIIPEDIENIDPFEQGEARELLGDGGHVARMQDLDRMVPESRETIRVPGSRVIESDRFELPEQGVQELERVQPDQGILFTRSEVPAQPIQPEILQRVRPAESGVLEQKVPQLSGPVIDVQGREVVRPREDAQDADVVGRTGVQVPAVQDTTVSVRRRDRATRSSETQTETQRVEESTAVVVRPEPSVPAVIPQRPTRVVRPAQPSDTIPGVQVPGIHRVVESERSEVPVQEHVPQEVAPARQVEVVERDGEVVAQDTAVPARVQDREPQSGVAQQNPQTITENEARDIAQRRVQLDREMEEVERRMAQIRARQAEEEAAGEQAVARARREAQEQLEEARRVAEQNRTRIESENAARQAEQDAQTAARARAAARQAEQEAAVRRLEEEAEESAAEQRRRMFEEAEDSAENAIERRAAREAEEIAAARRRAIQRGEEAAREIESGLVRRRVNELENRAPSNGTAGRRQRGGSIQRRPHQNHAGRNTSHPRRPEIPGRVIDAEYRVVDRRPVPRVPRVPGVPRRPIVGPVVRPFVGLPGILPQVAQPLFDSTIYPVLPHIPAGPVVPVAPPRPVRIPKVDVTPHVPAAELPRVDTQAPRDGSRNVPQQPVKQQDPLFDTQAPRLFQDYDYPEGEQPVLYDDYKKPEESLEQPDFFEDEYMPPFQEMPFEEQQSAGQKPYGGPAYFDMQPIKTIQNIEFPDKAKQEKDPNFVGAQSAQELKERKFIVKPAVPQKIKRETTTVIQEPATEYEDYNTIIRVFTWSASSILLMILLYFLRRYLWS